MFDPSGYLAHLAAKGYLGKNTVDHRRHCLQRFFAYLAEFQVFDPQTVTREHVEGYFTYLKTEYLTYKGTPLSNSAYRSQITAVDDFFKWLKNIGQILISPVVHRPVVPRNGKIPEVFTEEEMIKILDSCPFNTPYGLRVGELIGLNVEDFLAERQELVIVKGKGAKDRVVPVGEIALSPALAD